MEFNQFWSQVTELTQASLKSRYRRTFAGFIWVVLNPLMMFGVQSLVFKTFMRIDVPNYYLFLLGGLLPWIFFSQTIQMGTPIFVAQSHLLRSFKINPMVILASQVLDNFINFIASFLLILLPFYLLSGQNLLPLLLLPLAIVALLIATLGACIIFGTINVFFRDTNFVIGFMFSLLFFMTPIFYPKEYVPERWQWLVELNPLNYLLGPFKIIIHNQGIGFVNSILWSFGVAIAFALIAILVWRKKRNGFYFRL